MDRPWIEAGLKYAELRPDDVPSLLVQRVARIRALSTMDQRFVAYRIGSPVFTAYILGVQTGTAVPHISGKQIQDFEFILPPMRDQKAIGELLGALNDKIPVNDRIIGISGSLLTAHYVASSKGAELEMKLGELIELKYGKALKEENDRTPGSVPVFGGNGISGWHNVPLRDGPGIIVGRKGANAGSVSWSQGPFWAIDTSFYVEPLSGSISLEFLYFLLGGARLRNFVGDSAIPGLNREIALSLTVRIPPEETIELFTETAKPLLALNARITEESRSIAELRDTLLPKLMSGEIRARDAEQVVEDVT
jgi:type I restriction enzyme, S subunit